MAVSQAYVMNMAPRRLAPERLSLEGIGLAIVIFNCFLPYLNFGPISVPSQVQPWAALLAWIYVIFRAITMGIKVSPAQWVLLIFSAWFMLYVYEGQGFDITTYFRRSAAFLLSAGIFLTSRYLTPRRLWRLLKVTLVIWFAFAALRYVSSAAYFKIVTPLVPTVVDSSERGSSSLAPEATDFGFTMAFMILLCMIARSRLKEQGERAELWPLMLAVGGAVLSKSGTGFFGMALILMLHLADGSKIRGASKWLRYGLFAAAGVSAFFVLQSLPETGVRGVDLLSSTIRSPSDLVNETASYRIVHNLVGFFGFFDSKLMGFGAGSYDVVALQIYNRHNISAMLGLSGYYMSNMPQSLVSSPLAFFPVILLEFGIIGLVYIVYLFRFAATSRIPHKLVAVAMMFMTWAQSFPAAWPPFWVLLGLMMSPHFVSLARIEAKADEPVRPRLKKRPVMAVRRLPPSSISDSTDGPK